MYSSQDLGHQPIPRFVIRTNIMRSRFEVKSLIIAYRNYVDTSTNVVNYKNGFVIMKYHYVNSYKYFLADGDRTGYFKHPSIIFS